VQGDERLDRGDPLSREGAAQPPDLVALAAPFDGTWVMRYKCANTRTPPSTCLVGTATTSLPMR
jgi:hypothetical protein